MIELTTQKLKLIDIFSELAREKSAELGQRTEEILLIRKGLNAEIKEVDEKERSVVGYVSTADVDRDNEVILPGAFRLDHFRKNPVVLWAHSYHQPPVGRAMWIKTDGKGLIAKTQFAQTAIAEEVFNLYRDGFMRAFSVGFIPIEWVDGDGKETPRRTYKKVDLLEYSCVPVPANPVALQQAYEEGRIKTKILCSAFGLEEKSVIPYQETPKDPEDAEWNGPKEIRQAEVEDLKIMCTWYDKENADTKQAYKLPHHRASGNHNVVWRGVVSAMGALLGARGGVDIPEKDRKGVYNHLKKHYKQFDKEPPEFREYSEDEIKVLFRGVGMTVCNRLEKLEVEVAEIQKEIDKIAKEVYKQKQGKDEGKIKIRVEKQDDGKDKISGVSAEEVKAIVLETISREIKRLRGRIT